MSLRHLMRNNHEELHIQPHYFCMEGNSVLTDYYCTASEGQIYEDTMLKQFSRPILSLKLTSLSSMVLILDTESAWHSSKSLQASIFRCCYVHMTTEYNFFRKARTLICSDSYDSALKIRPICL